jgi:hypothetical protein
VSLASEVMIVQLEARHSACGADLSRVFFLLCFHFLSNNRIEHRWLSDIANACTL